MADLEKGNVTSNLSADTSNKVEVSKKKTSNKLKTGKVDDIISRGRAMTGSPADQININPIQEQEEKHAVMAFGRFNPPTSGHAKLIKRVEDVASRSNGQAHIVASHSEGTSKNPVPKEAKVGYLKKMVGKGTQVSSSSSEQPSLLNQAVKLHKQGVKHLTVVAGSDRVENFHKLLHAYNGVPSTHGEYNFKSIKVVSAGSRDPDSEGTEGMSGTKMRHIAHHGTEDQFKKGLPKELHPHAKEIIGHIKAIKEGVELDFNFADFLEEDALLQELNTQQRMKRKMIMKRYGSKIELARKRAMMRRASSKVINNRARKMAIQKIKTRLSGGRDPNSLSNMEKDRIEKLLNKRKGAVRRLAMKLIPQVRKRETSRFMHKEQLDLTNINQSYDTLVALYDVAIEEAIDRKNTHIRDEGTTTLVNIYKSDTPNKNRKTPGITRTEEVDDDKSSTIEAIRNRFNPVYFKGKNKQKPKEKEEVETKPEVKEDVEQIDEAIKLNSKVRIHDPGKRHHGKEGTVVEFRRGLPGVRPPYYTVDHDGTSTQFPRENIRIVKEDVDSMFEEKFGKNREAIPRSGQDRDKIDLVVRDGSDRKQSDKGYRQQSIEKKIVEAKKSAWERMLANNPKHAESEARAQQAKAGLEKANKDYQAILDREAAAKKLNKEERGLWDNIHAKRKRIKAGSGERMRKPGSEGAPTPKDLKNSQ